MKRKFEEVFEEKIEGDLEDDFKVELFNEDGTELIANSGGDFCQTDVKTEINDDGEVRENEDVKIEIFEAEVKQEDIYFEDFAEEYENQVVKVEKNDHDMVNAQDRKSLKLTTCSTTPSDDVLRKVFTTGLTLVFYCSDIILFCTIHHLKLDIRCKEKDCNFISESGIDLARHKREHQWKCEYCPFVSLRQDSKLNPV